MSDEKKKLRLMRHAKASSESRHSIGGLEKQGGHKPRPITLPTTPWDDNNAHKTAKGGDD